jgi:hypothetical protein
MAVSSKRFHRNQFQGVFRRSGLAAALASTALLGLGGRAQAEQFTMFDITFTATAQNTHDAHFDVKPPMYMFTQPDNWTSPIDYTKGMVYIELESIEKPSAEPTQIDICFLTSKGYGCRNTMNYTAPGRYTTARPVMTGFYGFNRIDWTKKIPLVQFVTKDANNVNGGRDKAKFLPHKSRLAITFVSPGGTYTPPPGWSAAPATDAGAPAADAGAPDPSGPADAAAPMTDAGVSGSGGASGSGSGGASGASGGSSGGGSASGGASGGGATGGSSGTGTGGSSAGSGSGGRKPDPEPVEPEVPAAKGPCAYGDGRISPAGALTAAFALGLVGLASRRRKRN